MMACLVYIVLGDCLSLSVSLPFHKAFNASVLGSPTFLILKAKLSWEVQTVNAFVTILWSTDNDFWADWKHET